MSSLISVIIVNVTYFCWVNSMSEVSPTVAEGIGWTGKTFYSGQLIFEDNFDSFNESIWVHEALGPGHQEEFEWYTNSTENSYVENGVLHIAPTLLNDSNTYIQGNFHPIASAELSTKGLFSFKYGTLEIGARIPLGDWLWPALWMLPLNNSYGPWPISGEIDLMEARSNKNLTSGGNMIGVQQVGCTLHWGPNPNSTKDMWRLTHYTKNNDTALGYSDGFHVYKLIWTTENITFCLDGEDLGTVAPAIGGFWSLGNFTSGSNPWINGSTLAPFDKQFYLIINLAVGGTSFFSDTSTNQGGKPWNNSSPDAVLEFLEGQDQWLPTWNITTDQSHLMIDYVRIWAL